MLCVADVGKSVSIDEGAVTIDGEPLLVNWGDTVPPRRLGEPSTTGKITSVAEGLKGAVILDTGMEFLNPGRIAGQIVLATCETGVFRRSGCVTRREQWMETEAHQPGPCAPLPLCMCTHEMHLARACQSVNHSANACANSRGLISLKQEFCFQQNATSTTVHNYIGHKYIQHTGPWSYTSPSPAEYNKYGVIILAITILAITI